MKKLVKCDKKHIRLGTESQTRIEVTQFMKRKQTPKSMQRVKLSTLIPGRL